MLQVSSVYELVGKKNLSSRFKSRLKRLFNGKNKSKRKQNITSTPTIDWKHLSPTAPPLPSLENRLSQLFSRRPSHGILEPYPFGLSPLRHQITDVTNETDAPRLLHTIPEETDMVESSGLTPSIPKTSSEGVACYSMGSSASKTRPSTSSSRSSNSSYLSPASWITQEQEYQQTDEQECKIKFAALVQAAHAYHLEHKSDGCCVAHTQVIFDVQDTVRIVRITQQGQMSDCLRFFDQNVDSLQYLPPEAVFSGFYNHQLADVWTLGVNLYRMLTGRFPFTAPDDRKLFGKMMHGDFSIPTQVSEDARDMLRRMLAPPNTRASLDLVLFHPWLKPYCISRHSPPAAISPSPKIGPNLHLHLHHHRRKSLKHAIAKAALIFLRGPNPPPKRPYRQFGRYQATVVAI